MRHIKELLFQLIAIIDFHICTAESGAQCSKPFADEERNPNVIIENDSHTA
jgi:hypothetical protein